METKAKRHMSLLGTERQISLIKGEDAKEYYKKNILWLDKQGFSISKFASVLGAQYPTVRKWLRGAKPRIAWRTLILQRFESCPFLEGLDVKR